MERLAYRFAKQHGVLLKTSDDNHATILYRAPLNPAVLVELRRYLACPLHYEEVSASEFQTLLTSEYAVTQDDTAELVAGVEANLDLTQLVEQLPLSDDLLDSDSEAPVIALLNGLFRQAIGQQASDIHIDTLVTSVIVRFRIDGLLETVLQLPQTIAPLLVLRIKVMAKLDIAEKRLPQDGRMRLQLGDDKIDVRISILPANHGERLVLRLLNRRTAALDLTKLGMPANKMDSIRQLITQPHGIILITGPTGSGKTTTLYAMLAELDHSRHNIMTIEDPVEYDLPGIAQTQINDKQGLTFAQGLRALLRQDPDIIMIGEIRDSETAQIAIQASLTGHLVFATLHTNDAVSAITRLRDMGIAPFLIASSLLAIMAQRLIRQLCPHCKQSYAITSEQAQAYQLPASVTTLSDAVGCPQCHHSGYLGRSGIYELITIDPTLRDLIHRNTPEQVLAQYAHRQSNTLYQDGLRYLSASATSAVELTRVSSEQL